MACLFFNLFGDLRWGKAMVACTKPQQRKKEESGRLSGEKIRSSLLILDLKEGKCQDPGKEEQGQMFLCSLNHSVLATLVSMLLTNNVQQKNSLEQCSLTGGSLSSLAISVFLIEPASFS